jgi:hypothetical protein
MLEGGGSEGVCDTAIPGRSMPQIATLRTVREVFTARFDASSASKGSLFFAATPLKRQTYSLQVHPNKAVEQLLGSRWSA